MVKEQLIRMEHIKLKYDDNGEMEIVRRVYLFSKIVCY